MGVKEEAKEVVSKLIGPVAEQKVESMDDSDPKQFLDNCKTLIVEILGKSIGRASLEPIYDKYVK